jgi:hypothetical protein
LTETAPVHTWEPILAAWYTAEIEKATDDTTRNYTNRQEHHFTDSKVLYAHAETEELLAAKTDQYGNDARVFNLTQRVINRWTTLPLPTTETWIRVTGQDPDLRIITRAMKEKTTPLKAVFSCKKYHDEPIGQRIILEEGILYQLEQPKATRIRQLQRKIVPLSLRATILAAYHATPLAGHTGVYKTYWRIAARFWWPEMSIKSPSPTSIRRSIEGRTLRCNKHGRMVPRNNEDEY